MINNEKLKKIRDSFDSETENLLTHSFKGLSDPNRYRIFNVLSENKKLSASEIAVILKISRPLTSQHLKILEQAKLLKKEKIGQKKHYQLNQQNPLVKVIVSIMKKNIPK